MVLFKDKKSRQKANRQKILKSGIYFFGIGICLLGFYYFLERDFSSIIHNKRIQEKSSEDWFFCYLFSNGLFFMGSCLTFLGIAAFMILLFNLKEG